ncbi:hypothetical protein BpHYR1_038079 [Brachionus plicatilis]|uniref:Uncharacterized protein n=1 Tax=Brachionus plicatilis TaxID=10195 RepID=A0A3M7Q3V5_BRAPC|nr:hypothetical protein BpHYR1_038079 [Brachionus plicatilis]
MKSLTNMITTKISKFFLLLLCFITFSKSNICPLFKCSPEIVSLDQHSLNSTFDIQCVFYKKVKNPTDIIWRFTLGNYQRLITNLEGDLLAPFKHTLVNDNIDDPNVQSISKLTIYLANESYYTNYTLVHFSEMCQQTIRLNLQERASSLINTGSLEKINLLSNLIFISAVQLLNFFQSDFSIIF